MKGIQEDKLAGVPMLIYANKQDLISALPAEEIEEQLSLGMINDRAWTIIACSAKEKEGNIEEPFEHFFRFAGRYRLAYSKH